MCQFLSRKHKHIDRSIRRWQNKRMKQTLSKLLCIMLALTFVSLLQTPSVHADPNNQQLKIIQGVGRHIVHSATSTSSTNWAGYTAETSLASPTSSSVGEVSGQWTVPTVTCTLRTTSYSASWVGIDGYSDNTVEQTGTEQDCNRGRAQYYAWYELYPAYSYEVSLPVKAGNIVTADVKYIGNNSFTLTLVNKSTNQTFTTTKVASGALRESAEWVAEAPANFFGILPLSNFGTEMFSNALATINNTTGTISNTAWQNQPINMVTSSGLQNKATTSPLSTDGSGFSVTWIHS
jgi:hypothetical protein